MKKTLFDNGNDAYNSGDYAESIYQYNKLLDNMSDYESFTPSFGYPFDEVTKPLVLNNLGMSYSKSGNFGKGMECFEKAVRLNSNFYKGWYNIALLNYQLGNAHESLKACEKALAIYPDYAQALNLYNHLKCIR